MSYSTYKSKLGYDSQRQSPPLVNAALNRKLEIEQLDQKVDVILQHNDILKEQNQALKKKVLSLESTIGNYRASSERISYTSLTDKRQLEFKQMQNQQLKKQAIIDKQVFAEELDQITCTLKTVTDERDELLKQKSSLQGKILSFKSDHELEKQKLYDEHKKHLSDLELQKNFQQQEKISQIKNLHNEEMEKLKIQFSNKIKQMEEDKTNSWIQLESKHEKQIKQMRKEMQDRYQYEVKKIQEAAMDKCQKQRQKAQQFIQTMLNNQKQNQQYGQEKLKKQIENLQNSLNARQRVIESLLQSQQKPESEYYYDEVQSLRERIKQMTESFFKETELLKLKLAIKHDTDVQEVAKVYSDRLQIAHTRISFLQHQNQRLRDNYEQEIRNKLKLRQKFDLQTSKLKNVIRKMKIELESYGKQLRLNIEGIKDHANSFSMSILTQLGQQKNKKGFYQEEIRKMRDVVDLKEEQIAEITRQSKEKVRYYQQKLENAKRKIEQLNEQLKEKQKRFDEEIQQQEQQKKAEIEKERNHLGEEIDHLQQVISQQKQRFNDLNNECQKYKRISKEKQHQIGELNHQLDLSKAHVETLRLEMEMFAANVKPDQALTPLKDHYERIIEQIERDKQQLKEANSLQADQIGKLVVKYQDMERTLNRTLSSMKKNSELSKKVVQMGLDENLVKNLGEVFPSKLQ